MSWIKADWSSLEVAKLAVPALSALLLAFVGYVISSQLSNQGELVKKRLDLYDAIARKSNRMFAYYFYIGRWKEETPESIISYKRELDEIMYSYEPIFTAGVHESYNTMIDQLFTILGRWGEDAKLRTTIVEREKFSRSWKPEYRDRFTNEDNRDKICGAYNEFINKLSTELQMQRLTGEGSRVISCPPMRLVEEPA